MLRQLFDKTAASIKPLNDTWGEKGDAGSWCITFPFDFTSLSIPEVNAWYAISVAKTLDAFSELARAWEVSFNTIYRDDVEGVSLEWKPGDFYEEYIENVFRAIREFPAPIYKLDIKVDLFVYVRTEESPDKPIRAWVRYLGELAIFGGPETDEPGLCFNINNTLFCSSFYGDNRELYSLNQPLLAHALRQWEEKCGLVNEVQGLDGIYKYGFLPGDTLPIDLVFDTWSEYVTACNWLIRQSFDFISLSPQKVNAWFAKGVTDTLEDFSDLARAWKVSLISSNMNGDEVEPVVLKWQSQTSHAEYMETVLKAIQEFPTSIYELYMEVDLFVYFRTRQSPDNPIRDWARLRNEFGFRLAPAYQEAISYFEIYNTLFSPRTEGKPDNGELYALNQPLLENALRRWEKRFGPICEVDGIPGIYEYGFKPEN